MSEGQQQKRKPQAVRQSASAAGPKKSVNQSAALPGLDIFGALTYEKK